MRKVLILEDNKTVMESIKKVVRDVNGGVEILTADNPVTACRLAMGEDIALFIVDIILNQNNPNDASGLDFISYIRGMKKYDFVPVIITTSVADAKLYAYDQLECFRYLEKPFDEQQLSKAVARALQMPQKTDEERCIHLRDETTIQVQKVKEIIYIYYKDRKLLIRSVDGITTFYYKSIMEIKKQLMDSSFLQCNRNTLVNRDFVLKINRKQNEIVLKNNYGVIKMGSVYRKKIIEEFTYD
jgi:two-component system LytT family response regulator